MTPPESSRGAGWEKARPLPPPLVRAAEYAEDTAEALELLASLWQPDLFGPRVEGVSVRALRTLRTNMVDRVLRAFDWLQEELDGAKKLAEPPEWLPDALGRAEAAWERLRRIEASIRW